MSITPDQFLRSMADSTRLRLLALLSEKRELCVCELKDALGLAQPKVSRHLAVLRECGLLMGRREGLWIYYRLDSDMPAWAARALAAVYDGCHGKSPYREDIQRLAEVCCRQGDACDF
ncbi:MAG: metalloregulator ArsR/SmtB family transcription factor [Candidatus Sedimenticola sp. (ex Thyasira tokunagai)]